MSSIPLPALNVRPPQQQESPLQQYAQLQQLLNARAEAPLRQQALQQQVQAGQQSLQSGQLQLSEQQRAVKDQEALTAAMHEWDGQNFDGLMPLLMKSGASASAVVGMKGKILEQKKINSQMAAEDATTGSKNIDTKLKQNDMIAGAIGNVIGMPDDQLASGLASTAQELAQQGLIDPQHAQAATQIAQSGNPEQIRKQLSILQKSYMGQSAQMTAAQKQAQIDAGRAATELNGKQFDLAQGREKREASAQEQNLQLRRREVAQSGERLNLEKKKSMLDESIYSSGGGEAYLQGLPSNIQMTVKKTAAGDLPMPNSRTPAGQAVREAVLRYDPTYTDTRYTTKQNFKTKNDSQAVSQLATAMEHLENATKNSVKIGYAPALGTRMESPGSAAYEKDIQLYTQEVGKMIKNGVVTEGEGHDLLRGLDSSREGVRDSSLKELTTLLSGKVGGVFQKYKTGTGQDLPVAEYFDKPTQERLKRFGVIPESGSSGESAVSAGNSPQEGATKTNSHGDKIVFKGGQWQIQ